MNAIKAFIKAHSLISATSLFVIVVAVVAVIVFNVGSKSESASSTMEDNTQQESVSEETTEDIQDLTLQCDAYPEVNAVMEAYHKALAENDEEMIKKYLLYVNENELVNIAVKSEYVESYNDIHCYTQEGYEEGSYYVYVSYQLKMVGFDELLPGLFGMYYCPNEEGEYHIYRKSDMSENVLENFYTAYMKQEVQDLYNRVALEYNEIVDSNDELKTFMNGFEELVTEEMVKMIAIREASEAMEASEEAEDASETASETTQTEEQTPVTETVCATTTVNVRSSDSETADKLGKVSTGTQLTRLESLVNGWSKVIFQGEEGYIKSEFLEVVSTNGGGGNTSNATEYVTVKENVNIRESASQTADRVALAYQGTRLILIEHMSNGWTKVEYNGEEAYVKSEYVE